MRITGDSLGQQGNPVHRHQIHAVHEEDPTEDREGQWSNQGILAIEAVLDAALHHLDDDFQDALEYPRCATGGALDAKVEHAQEHQYQQQGDHHRIDVDRPETHLGRFLDGMGKTPAAISPLTEGQEAKVVLYVFRCGLCGFNRFSCHEIELSLVILNFHLPVRSFIKAMRPARYTKMKPANSARVFRGSTKIKLSKNPALIINNLMVSPR